VTDPEFVLLFHGTNGDVADVIRREGVHFADLRAEAQLVGEQFGLDPDAVWARADLVGFTKAASARMTSVSFAGHPINAARYAGVAGGEARREMYQAAWLIMNDSEESGRADRWSFEQTQAERILITVRVPLPIVQAALGTEVRTDPMGFDPIETAINLRIDQEIPPDWIVGIEPVERVMDHDDVRNEYGVALSADDLPSDAPYPWEGTWWESSIRRWFSERR